MHGTGRINLKRIFEKFTDIFNWFKVMDNIAAYPQDTIGMDNPSPTSGLPGGCTPGTQTTPTTANPSGLKYYNKTIGGQTSMYNATAYAAGGGVGQYTPGVGQGYYTITGTMSTTTAASVITLYGQNKEIVRLNSDGTVTWANGVEIDEAADAFAKSLMMGGERAIGITDGVKNRMRDSVFNDLIAIAKDKGTLSADDLTYLLEASKIMEKLKGIK